MKANPVDAIPPFNAKSDVWIQFHKVLKSNFGKKVANQIWVKAWSIRGNPSANNNDLREYLEENGIKIDKSAWDSVVDLGSDVTDFFGDIFTVGKWVGISLAVIILGGLGMTVYNLAKRPAENIGKGARAFVGKGA